MRMTDDAAEPSRFYPPAPYEDELAAELRTQRTDPPRPRTRPRPPGLNELAPEDAYAVELHARIPTVDELAAALRVQRAVLTFPGQDSDELPPEDVIRTVQSMYNCSRADALSRIRNDIRAVRAAQEDEWLREVRRLLFQQVAGMPGMRPAGEYVTDPYVVLRGEAMPEGDLPPTGKGDPLAEVYGAFDRTMAAIDAVLEEEPCPVCGSCQCEECGPCLDHQEELTD